MRCVAGLTLVALAGCHREVSFDERYASAESAIFATAAAIDTELAVRQSEGAQADALSGPVGPSDVPPSGIPSR